MRRYAVAVAIVATVALPARPEVALPTALQILGTVTNAARPVANALVVALNLNNFDAIQTFTTSDGKFTLPPLQTGIYKVIAVKAGFAPAIATVMPTKSDHKVTLRLENNAKAKQDDEIWEIRGSLPADVLREIDQVLESPAVQAASYDVPRFKGELSSMTGMAAAKQADGPSFAQTALGVQSRIGDNWQLGIRGDMQRFDDPTDNQSFGAPVAQSSAMSMELRSSPTESVRYATSRSMWRYADGISDDGTVQAGIRTDNLEWQHGDARVKVRYFTNANVYQASGGSDLIEVGGDTTLLQTRRNDIGVSLRVRQENVRSTMSDTLRTADVAANGTLELVPSFIVHYGMASRLAFDRTEWAPSTGVEWKMTKNTALIGSGSYKMIDAMAATRLVPAVSWSEDGQVLPKYTYSFGLVSSRDDSNRFSAVATISAADEPVRVIITDATQQFWDSLYVDSGDMRRDLRLSYRHDFGPRFAIDISTAAGTATPRQATHDMQKVYVTADLQSIFTPTRTTMAVSYRNIDEPLPNRSDYRSSRVNVRLAQSLYLPIDFKLLIGVEIVHAQNSPFLLDTLLPEDYAKKYIGGLAVNF